jgi:hypothetical protein
MLRELRLGAALRCSAIVIGVMLTPSAALAFSYEDGTKNLLGPQFDIEEQARQFRTPDMKTDAPTAGKSGIETPAGTLRFGVHSGGPTFGSPFGSSFQSRAREDQRHFDRMLSPFPPPEDAR